MTPNTLFRASDAIEATSIDEAVAAVEKSKYEQDTVYAEGTEIKHLPDANEFEADFDGRKARFTREGFLQLAGLIGVPRGFAEKVPNSLLVTNLTHLLDGFEAKKMKIIFRTGVVVGAMRPGMVWMEPKTALTNLAEGCKQRKFVVDRIAVTDDGMVANAFESPAAKFVIGKDDTYDLGLRLDYGYERSGLLKGSFFSRRQACLNIAHVVAGRTIKREIQYERVKQDLAPAAFGRFHDRVTAPTILADQISAAHASLQGNKILDQDYVRLYKRLSKIVGKEPALGVLQMEEPAHEAIVQMVKTRETLQEASPSDKYDPMPVDPVELYSLFNKLTSLAHSYKGRERLALEELGGTLLPI